jgi:hypothetical protein
MPEIMIDELLLMIIAAGMGLTVAYLRAEYVLHRGFKAAEHEKLSIQRDLHGNRSRPKQMDVPMAVFQNHEDSLGTTLRFARRPNGHRPTIRESAEVGTPRHTGLA